jgi:hypothetical protein
MHFAAMSLCTFFHILTLSAMAFDVKKIGQSHVSTCCTFSLFSAILLRAGVGNSFWLHERRHEIKPTGGGE